MNLVVVSSSQLGSVFIKENLVKQEKLEYPGLTVIRGKLQGHKITLIEPGEGLEKVSISPEILLNDLAAKHVVSLGKAVCNFNLLAPGDIVVSAEAADGESNAGSTTDPVEYITADQKLIDLALRAVEKFEPDEKACKVVVGRVVSAPTGPAGKASARKQNKGIHCVDPEGVLQAKGWSEEKIPFVLIRTITPPANEEQRDMTRFNWDMAKRNFWMVKGMLDAAKKNAGRKMAQS